MTFDISSYEHLIGERANSEVLLRLAYALNLSGCETVIEKDSYQLMLDAGGEITNLENYAARKFTPEEKDFIHRAHDKTVKLTQEQKDRLIGLDFQECADDIFMSYFLPVGESPDTINTLVGTKSDIGIKLYLRTLFKNSYPDCIVRQLEAIYGISHLKNILQKDKRLSKQLATKFVGNSKFWSEAFKVHPSMSKEQLEEAVNNLVSKGVADPKDILQQL